MQIQTQEERELENVETAIERIHARMRVARGYELRDLAQTVTSLEEQALYLRQQLS